MMQTAAHISDAHTRRTAETTKSTMTNVDVRMHMSTRIYKTAQVFRAHIRAYS